MSKNIPIKKLISLLCVMGMFFSSGCGSSTATADRTSSFTSQTSSTDQAVDPSLAGQDTPPGLSDEVPVQTTDSEALSTDLTSVDASSNENSISYVGDLASADGEIDVDLTTLSSVVIYSVVFNMMQKPEDYIGKKVRIFGNYSTAYEEQSGVRYHACIIQDATQCCAQGIEFELTDDYVFPDDYPEVWDDIVVVGTFDIYKDGGSTYCTLRNAHLE